MRHDRKSSFMSKSAPVAAPLADPLFARLGPLAALADLGTAGYPRAVRRRLTIVNAMAFLIAIFSAVYALVFAYFDVTTYMPSLGDRFVFEPRGAIEVKGVGQLETWL